MIKLVNTATLVAIPIVGVIGIGLVVTEAQAAPNPCRVGIIVYEDGSWSGSSVYLDGVKVAHRWEVGQYDALDLTYVDARRQRVRVMGGFPADHNGKVCDTYIGR